MLVVDGLFHTLTHDPPPECNQTKDIVDMILEGGVDCLADSIVSDAFPSNFMSLCEAVYEYELLEEVNSHKLLIVRSFEDIQKAKSEKKLALILSSQGSDFLEANLRLISMAHHLGLRMIQITYNTDCAIGSGVYVKEDKGLTKFGEQAILEMDRVGILIDLSHVGFKTAEEAMDVTANPTVFSHAGLKVMNDHTRNIPDHLIRKLAEKGGVLGVCPHGVMTMRQADKRPTVHDYVDTFIHIANLTGSMDHAGVGTDRWSRDSMANRMKMVGFERTVKGFFGPWDGDSKHVAGFNYYDEWSNLLDTMLSRGLTEEDARKILGKNWLRVYQAVWK